MPQVYQTIRFTTTTSEVSGTATHTFTIDIDLRQVKISMSAEYEVIQQSRERRKGNRGFFAYQGVLWQGISSIRVGLDVLVYTYTIIEAFLVEVSILYSKQASQLLSVVEIGTEV